MWGVAWLDQRIYVTRTGSTHVIVYSGVSPYECVDDVAMDNTAVFWDMIACSTNNCLYITDFANRCVWRLTSREQNITR